MACVGHYLAPLEGIPAIILEGISARGGQSSVYVNEDIGVCAGPRQVASQCYDLNGQDGGFVNRLPSLDRIKVCLIGHRWHTL